MKGPDFNSNRSRKRRERRFVSLEVSCRKHRRARRRLIVACTITRAQYKPGEKVAVPIPGKASPAFHTAGGCVDFH